MEKDLVEYIAKTLVDDPSGVVVNVIEGEKSTILELKVADNDIGKVIGKHGRIAKAVRTLLSAASDACNPVVKDGKRFRALNPWSAPDLQLLTFLAQGERHLNGFRNKDLRAWCNPQADPSDPVERKRLSGKATRAIRLLRAHGLVRKVRDVNRYVLTDKGQQFVTALLSASRSDIKALMEIAA